LVEQQKRLRDQQAKEAKTLEQLAEDARNGNPWPYIRVQWGDVLLDAFQKDLIECVTDSTHYDVWVKGNTGCGKGASAAIAICVFFATRKNAKVVITRDNHAGAIRVMYGEVVKWWKKMRAAPEMNVLTDRMVDPNNAARVMAVVNPESDEGFSGTHEEDVLLVFDEASASVLESRFKLAFTQATKFLAIANPRTTSGTFRMAFPVEEPDITQSVVGPYGLRRLITISGEDCLNVKQKRLSRPVAPAGGITIGERTYQAGEKIDPVDYELVKPIIPGQTCYDTFLGHLADPDPRWVRIFAYGKFPDDDPQLTLFSMRAIQPCVTFWERWWKRWREKTEPREKLVQELPVTCFGLDVGASIGGDPSILTAGGPNGVRRQYEARNPDTTKTVDWVIKTIKDDYGEVTFSTAPIAVDMDGLGKGVGDMLRKAGMRVMEIRGNDKSSRPKSWANRRTEAYATLSERIDPNGKWAGQPYALPNGLDLHQELQAHERKFVGHDGLLFRLPSKRTVPGVKDSVPSIEERIGRSPDRSDSLVYCNLALKATGMDLGKAIDMGYF